MPLLNQTDEVNLLIRVLKSSPQADGWNAILQWIADSLPCKPFLSEFDSGGTPVREFGAEETPVSFSQLLTHPNLGGDEGTLRFLLNDAPLLAASFRALPGDWPGLAGTTLNTPGKRDSLPAIVAPLKRTATSTFLFGCVFTQATTETLNVPLANETFRKLLAALAPGLDIFLQMERERDNNSIQRLLISFMSCCAVLITPDRAILGHTANGLDALLSTGAADARDGLLVVKNKQLDTAIQDTLKHFQARPAAEPGTDTAEAPTLIGPETSIFIEDPEESLKRVTVATVAPSPRGQSMPPWLMVGVFQPPGTPEHVEKVLQDRYDLSQSEAHLARHLAMTGTLNDTVEQLEITRNTAKTHLRRIFDKTGARTQLQLARLVHELSGLF